MSNVFVDAAWLEEMLGESHVRVVDTRSEHHGPSGISQFEDGHIRGAVHLDYATDLADPATPWAKRVAPPERFAQAMSVAGIGDHTLVVAYDNGDVPFAARMLWMLRYYGHDEVRILAGGLTEWIASGKPTTTDFAYYAPATFTPRVRPQLRATLDEVQLLAANAAHGQLVETQRDMTYAMRDRLLPNAIRLSGNLLLEDERGGRFPAREKLQSAIDAAGLDPKERTVTSCGSGVSASGSYIALLEAGFEDVAVYDGSWLEWSHDPSLPTEPKPS